MKTMAYSDFTLEAIVAQQQLQVQVRQVLFQDVMPVVPSEWLQETLSVTEELGLFSGTEKARSEFIIAPILIELERRNRGRLMIFSGKSLDVDRAQGLNGECDFLLCKGEANRIVQAPIFSVVEAKKQDLDLGIGQCVAQMVGANLFNQRKGEPIPTLYGCVTTAERWQFLTLTQNHLAIDRQVFNYPNELDRILGILQFVLDRA
jgi:hypothetical protein